MIRALLVLVCLVAAAPARAQTSSGRDETRPGALPLVLTLPAGARAASLGGAYPLASPDADAVFQHPALMDGDRGVAGAFARFGGNGLEVSAAGGFAWWHGGLGVGARALSFGAVPFAGRPDASDAPVPSALGAFAAGEAGIASAGPIDVSEQLFTVSYARRVFGFRVGGAAKVIDLRAEGLHDTSVVADVGVARNFGWLFLAGAAQNLGGASAFGDAGTARTGATSAADGIDAARRPRIFTAGAATRSRTLGPLDVALAGQASWRRDAGVTAGGGAEISYWPVAGRTFTFRIGYRHLEDSALRPLTLGAGFAGDRISLDYSWQAVDAAGATHRFGLRIR
ncbi:MAG: hypothetical protein R2752_13465 [Vicinamibacterales bacterium]